ncbi:MAG: histidine kinase dimerization/phospho-acceptor domain-containing protein [Streptococcus salivarius]
MRFLSDVSHELRTPIAVIKGIWTSCNVGVKMTLRFLKKVLRLRVTRPTV